MVVIQKERWWVILKIRGMMVCLKTEYWDEAMMG